MSWCNICTYHFREWTVNHVKPDPRLVLPNLISWQFNIFCQIAVGMKYYAKVISVHWSETAWHHCGGMYELKHTKRHHTTICNWSDCYSRTHTCTCYRAIQNRSSLVRTHIPKLTHPSLGHPHKKRIDLQLTITQVCPLCTALAYMNMCRVGLLNCETV